MQRILLAAALCAAFATSAPAQLLDQAALYKEKTFASLEEALKSPKEVRKLRIVSSPMTALPPEILTLTNLQELSINNCKKLTALPPDLAKLPYLQVLNVNNNALAALPPELGKCPELTKLQCGSNPLTTLPAEFSALKKLRILEIVGVQFKEIPPCVFQMSALVDLNVNSNPIEKVAPGIGDLANLEELGLMFAAYTTLPPEIGKLSKLRRLLLNSSKLTALPPEIGKLAKLQWLSCQDNAIPALPPEIVNCVSLTELQFGGNAIKDLPAAFTLVGKLPRIQTVTYEARFTEKPSPVVIPDALTTWKTVEHVSFANHQLTEPGAVLKKLATLPKLKNLNLSRLRLGTLPAEIGQVAGLEMLRLDGNDLTALPESFKSLTKLKFLFAANENKFTPEEKAKWKAAFPQAKIDMGDK